MTYVEKMRKLADKIEELRIEIYQNVGSKTDCQDDKDDMKYLDDSLFKMQSNLRDMAVIVGCVNEEDF